MKFSEIFEMNAEMHPNGGATLPPAACAFILPELERKVRQYKEYLKEVLKKAGPDSISVKMTKRHLEGLVSITEAVRKGMHNKPDMS